MPHHQHPSTLEIFHYATIPPSSATAASSTTPSAPPRIHSDGEEDGLSEVDPEEIGYSGDNPDPELDDALTRHMCTVDWKPATPQIKTNYEKILDLTLKGILNQHVWLDDKLDEDSIPAMASYVAAYLAHTGFTKQDIRKIIVFDDPNL